ncbi:hypothetical protein H6F77_26945 [Microcoleus sp. FACHB-831]|uniref:hypothetical protein n=1 Tax=Microcoleus sp. FACHB-831 TaxID=2692827 RepID=UPI00168532F7|nr:hypothetical protein [Microcoleus sp. FACHB-831]MBD1924669.1 hypothetical protein [Microcoleus sp. FACHB-831]
MSLASSYLTKSESAPTIPQKSSLGRKKTGTACLNIMAIFMSHLILQSSFYPRTLGWMNGDRGLNYDERSQHVKAIAAIAGLCRLINTAPLGLLVGAKVMIRYAHYYLV